MVKVKSCLCTKGSRTSKITASVTLHTLILVIIISIPHSSIIIPLKRVMYNNTSNSTEECVSIINASRGKESSVIMY